MQIRTADLLITNELLYQLSYTGNLLLLFYASTAAKSRTLLVLNLVKFYIIPLATNCKSASCIPPKNRNIHSGWKDSTSIYSILYMLNIIFSHQED